MEAVTDKPLGNKNFHLRAAFGKRLTEHNDPNTTTVHWYLYRFDAALLDEFKRLCAEKGVTILKESVKNSPGFECGILEQ